ncbi:peptide/nickel transport system substrate-binding protein [Pararhizobium capsulatum DSM 1112]|uniref:Peptide/nickel transport system substrate-binding protein n=1 Tax=Pararhizobium capsulatum DSM 1112 TaxID=1121113 RepID=A0ABU0BWG0_9HYPH|nr:ABC transporter substrate-binding protein [Pararhizobium capsulatum]MDQ0322029.1 peptide/nickel transport system substrate-binding protein [Pararhizobium capsulatum DSM 1112]
MKRRDFLKTASLTALAFAAPLRWSEALAEDGQRIFTLAYPAGFPDLDPATSFSNDGAVLANAYETLTRYVPGFDGADARIEPLLAESWESSADGLAWTFKLRKGVRFHDGAELTAEAVKASIERTKKIGGGASFIWAPVETIETPDATTVKLRLSGAQPMDVAAAAGFAAWIYSPAAMDKDNAWFNAGNSAGTGPYKIERYEPGQRAILTRHDGYWGGWAEGAFDKVVFEITEDTVLAQSKIENGEVDWTYGLSYDNLEGLKARDDLKVVVNPSFETLVGMFNTRRAPLDNPKVRQALAIAFPYDDVIAAGTAGFGTRAKGAIPPGIWGHDPDAPVPATDIEKARALLAEAGVAEGLELSLTYATGDALEAVAGELWKANLEQLGITLTLQPMAWEAQWQLAKADPTAAQDIFLMYWWPTFVTPYDYLFNLFHSEKAPNYNLGYYANPAFDTLIDDANTLSATDRPGAEASFKKAQRILIDEAAAVFIVDKPNVHIIRSDVKNYVDNPAYGHVTFVHEMSR